MKEQDLISLKEAETLAGRSTIYRLLAAGAIRPEKVLHDQRTFVSLMALTAALEALPVRRGPKGRWRRKEDVPRSESN